MTDRRLLTVVLAAGEGTRMKSSRPKVLHEVAGRPMVAHITAAAIAAGSDALALVIGPGQEAVARAAAVAAPMMEAFTQSERLGTAHAALQARPALERAVDDVLIVFGDTPLVTAETFRRLRAPLREGAAVVVGAFEAADPTGYGRVLMEGSAVRAIREERDASPSERAVRLCNGGLMAIAAPHALSLLGAVGNANAKGEFYLPDIVEVARGRGLEVAAVAVDEEEIRGVNTRAQLAEVEKIAQRRLRAAALNSGVGMVAPETVFLSFDTCLAPDAWIGPNVVFGPGVTVEAGAEIHAFSHLSGCHVEARARIGPFARIRPGARIGQGAHIGNFVEVNRSVLAAGVEANHLAYLGDAEIGEGTNIGAGTITCNFDGAEKHQTRIGRGVFVGSNATLVAPLSIGDEVLIAAGSTVTEDVPAQALVFGRARQETKAERGGARIRDNKARRAARKAREAGKE